MLSASQGNLTIHRSTRAEAFFWRAVPSLGQGVGSTAARTALFELMVVVVLSVLVQMEVLKQLVIISFTHSIISLVNSTI